MWVALHGVSFTPSLCVACVCVCVYVCVCVSLWREGSTSHAARARLPQRREIAVQLGVAFADLFLELCHRLLVLAVVLGAPSGPARVLFGRLHRPVRLVVGRAVRAVAVGIVAALAREQATVALEIGGFNGGLDEDILVTYRSGSGKRGRREGARGGERGKVTGVGRRS